MNVLNVVYVVNVSNFVKCSNYYVSATKNIGIGLSVGRLVRWFRHKLSKKSKCALNMMDSLVAHLLGILLGVHDVAVAALKMLLNREGEDVSVNISLTNLPLDPKKLSFCCYCCGGCVCSYLYCSSCCCCCYCRNLALKLGLNKVIYS